MERNNVVEFVEENMKTIFAYALSRVSNKDEAEDLASDIILAILNSASKLKNDAALFGYVWAIANNTYKKYLHKRNQHSHIELDENEVENTVSNEDFVEKICKSEQINELRRELSLLSRGYRECTVAYYIDGLSCKDVSEKLGISLEMVKYYLFKTRKLLKEGIGMEREFGEKSYKPSLFEFVTIFSGKYNPEYRNLFNRKLPGNVLLSAYYTPMTIRELSIELGVSAAYMEDEVALLEKYNLLTSLPGGKYQTNLIIFTESYTEEFYKNAEVFCTELVGDALKEMKGLLPRIKEIGFRGADMEDNRLLWPLLWLIMHRGYMMYDKTSNVQSEELYSGETGINYGVNYTENVLNDYEEPSFAGYSEIDESYAASGADFGVLPKKNQYFSENCEKVKEAIYSNDKSYIIFQKKELAQVEELLKVQIEEMSKLYVELANCAEKTMIIHAPESVENLVAKVMAKTIFFKTVGLIGKCAVDSGEIFVPDDDKPIAVFVYKDIE